MRTLLDTTRLLYISTHNSFGYLDKNCTILRQSKLQLKWQRTLKGPILDRIAIAKRWFPNEKESLSFWDLMSIGCPFFSEWPHPMHIETTLI